jgi:hypothetical protein
MTTRTRLAIVVFTAAALMPSGSNAGERAVNLAGAARVSVSSQQSGFPATNAIDGNRSTEWASSEGQPWIKLEWKEPVTVGRLVLCDRANRENRAQGGKLLFSDGGTLDVDDIPPGGAPCTVRLEPRRVKWLRLDLFSARGAHPGLAELEVYSEGGEPPKPAPTMYPLPGTRVTIEGSDQRITAVDGVREGKWCGAMWCPFAGTSVKLIANKGPRCGLADIYIDGLFWQTADWYSPRPVADAAVFTTQNLADGKHLLGILTRGKKRPEATGTAVNWSRVEYVAGAHPERFVPVRRTRFDPNVPLWLDDRGEPIQGHMGGIMYHDGRYYMIGNDFRGRKLPGFNYDWGKNQGMAIYSSPDLMNWTYHCHFCQPSSDPAHPLYNYTVAAGRGKLLRATGTGKFVALFQMASEIVGGAELNRIAAAVAEKPEGPYQWHGFLRQDGVPLQGADTAVFTDEDGSQYLVTGKHAADWHRYIADCLCRLAPDCLSVVKAKVLGTGGEAPAIFKHHDTYYLLHSRLSGLAVNDNFYHTATNIWGPWQAKGKIAAGEHAANTFLTQTMDVVAVGGRPGAFIWIGDSLRSDAHPYTRTVWLPVVLRDQGTMEVRWRDSWDLSVFAH